MYEYEAGVIRRLIRDQSVRVIYSDHAERVRMVARGIEESDVLTVLKRCRVTEVRNHNLGPVWSAEGTDLDGRRLRICVSVREDRVVIMIVTTINLDAKN